MELQQDNDIKRIFSEIFGDSVYSSDEQPDFIKMITSDLPVYQQISEKLFQKIEEGGYYMFFYCNDKSGNRNHLPSFIEVSIANETADQAPPSILGTNPENNGKFPFTGPVKESEIDIEFYVNMPSECRYSHEDIEFEDMNNSMECAISRFDMDDKFGGSYLCEDTILANDSVKLYVRCSSNPENIIEHNFKILSKPVSSKNTTMQLDRQSIQEGGLMTDANTTFIDFYLDDPFKCSLAYSPGIVSEGNCRQSHDLSQGQYRCSFNMSVNKTKYAMDNFNISSINDTSDEYLDFSHNVSANILCRDRQPEGITNDNSFIYELEESHELSIIDYSPSGDVRTLSPTLKVETSESSGVQCGFSLGPGYGLVRMEKIQENKFSQQLMDVSIGRNVYSILCTDKYGNLAEKEISFYVLE